MRNLKTIASGEANVVAANNMFDVHYIKYHTGLTALYLPSWCEAPEDVTYAPVNSIVLLGPYRDNLGSAKRSKDSIGRDAVAWTHPVLVRVT